MGDEPCALHTVVSSQMASDATASRPSEMHDVTGSGRVGSHTARPHRARLALLFSGVVVAATQLSAPVASTA